MQSPARADIEKSVKSLGQAVNGGSSNRNAERSNLLGKGTPLSAPLTPSNVKRTTSTPVISERVFENTFESRDPSESETSVVEINSSFISGTNEKDDGGFTPVRVDSKREEKRRKQEEKMREKRDKLMREAEGGRAVCCRIVNPFIQHVLQVM